MKGVAEQTGLATGRETRYAVAVVLGHLHDDPTCDWMPSKPRGMAWAHEVLVDVFFHERAKHNAIDDIR